MKIKSYTDFFKFISGEGHSLSLEHRIFNSSSFLICILAILATAINLVLGIHGTLTIVTLVLSLIFVVIYYLSRFKQLFEYLHLPFVILIYSVAIITWLLNAGTKGPIAYAFIVLLIVVISISSKKYYKHYVVAIIVILLILFAVEYFYPEYIIDYENDQIRFFDVTSTLIIFLVLSSLSIRAIKRNYETEKELAEKRNKEITDSIDYASTIQKALLGSKAYIMKQFKDTFILFLPKDIVSGDFYWFKQVRNKKIIVAADCTGHGVPGALMSMLGMSFLSEIINTKENITAGEILNELKDKVVKSLRQDIKSGRDGMDLSLCIIDEDKQTLQLATASQYIYRIRDNKLEKIVVNRMSIGFSYTQEKFKSIDLDIKKDDVIYMFSDGYLDQFGEPKGDKFKTKPYKELLLRIHKKSMAEQEEIMQRTLKAWQGNYSQTDDILVIGIKL